MKLIDEKGKWFGKINIIDSIVFFLIIAAVLLVINLDAIKNVASAGGDIEGNVMLTYYIQDVKMVSVEGLAVGDPVYLKDTQEYLGEIVSLQEENAQIGLPTASGEYVYSVIPDKYNLTMVVSAQGSWNDRNVYVQNEPQYIGAVQQLLSRKNNLLCNLYGIQTSDDIN